MGFFAISGVLGLRLLRRLGEKRQTLECMIWVHFICALILKMISKITAAFEAVL